MNTPEPHLEHTLDSPVGPVRVVATARGLRAVLWPGDLGERVQLPDTLDQDDSVTTPSPDDGREVAARHLRTALRQLDDYFAGRRRRFDLPLDLRGTDFQRLVWTELIDVGFGETVSYHALAQRIGRPTASRAVGTAVGRNPVSIVVGCHRVIGADGSLTGFAGGLTAKTWLLRHEGATL